MVGLEKATWDMKSETGYSSSSSSWCFRTSECNVEEDDRVGGCIMAETVSHAEQVLSFQEQSKLVGSAGRKEW